MGKNDIQKLSLTADIQSSHGELLGKYPSIQSHLDELLFSWASSAQLELANGFPFSSYEEMLVASEHSLQRSEADVGFITMDLKQYNDFLQVTSLPKNEEYWKQELHKLENVQIEGVDSSQSLLLRRLLLEGWRKQLDKKHAEWELETIARLRAEYLMQLKDWLDKMQCISDTLEKLGLDPGYLLDLSEGNLSLSDIEQIK